MKLLRNTHAHKNYAPVQSSSQIRAFSRKMLVWCTLFMSCSLMLTGQPLAPTVTVGGVSTSPVLCGGESRTLTAYSGWAPNSGNMLKFASDTNQANTGKDTNWLAPPLVNFTGARGFTFEAWLNPTSATPTWTRILTLGGQRGNLNFILSGGNGRILELQGMGGFNAGRAYTVNSWFHTAITFDGDSIKIFINGVRVAGRADTSTVGYHIGQTNYYVIGKSGQGDAGARAYKGSMDEIRVWTVARSNADIAANFRQSVDPNTPGLFSYYRLDETSGAIAHDATPRANHAVLKAFVRSPASPWAVSAVTNFNTNNITYKWAGPSGTLSDTAGTTITASPYSIGDNAYVATAIDPLGNRASDTINLHVSDTAAPIISPAVSNGCFPSATLTASGTGPWQWTTGETTQSITVTANGKYSVISGNCHSKEAVVNLWANNLSVPQISFTAGQAALCTGQSATLTASATVTNGVAGKMLKFGSNTAGSNYVALPYDINSTMTTGVTWEGWFNIAALPTGYSPLFSLGSSVHGKNAFDSGSYILMQVENTGQLSWKAERRSNNNNFDQNNILPAGTRIAPATWYHLAMTLDGTKLYVYLNGVMVYTTGKNVLPAQLFSNPGADNYNLLGHGLYSDNVTTIPVFKGYMDEIRIWNTVRSAAQISANMAGIVDTATPGLLAWYRFDEDTTYTGPSIRSATGGNNAAISTNYLNFTSKPWVTSTLSPFTDILYKWTDPTGATAGTGANLTITPTVSGNYTVTATAGSTCTQSAQQAVSVFPNVVVTRQPATTTSCSGGPVSFSVAETGTVSRAWQVSTDGGASWSAISNSGLYRGVGTDTLSLTGTVPQINNYQYRVALTAGCGTVVTSGAATLLEDNTGAPSISLRKNQGDTVCPGTSIIFNANGIVTGPAPVYEWRINGRLVTGVSGTLFIIDSLHSGDVVKITMYSSSPCATAPTASDSIGPIFIPSAGIPASVRIASSPANPCPGTQVSFTASSTGGGPSPVYRWLYNGNPVGNGSPVYTVNSLNPGDTVICKLVSSLVCATPSVSISNTITSCIYQDYLWENFRDVRRIVYADYSGSLTQAANPGPSVIDPANTVGRYIRSTQTTDRILAAWDSTLVDLDLYKSGKKHFSLKLFSPLSGTVVKFTLADSSITNHQAYPAGRYAEFTATGTGPNVWEQLYLNTSAIPDATVSDNRVNTLIIELNPGSGFANNFYLDEIYGPHFNKVLAIAPSVNSLAKVQAVIYPNPAENTLHLKLNGAGYGAATIEITDLNGRLLQTAEINGAGSEISLNTSALSNGLYLCRISTLSGISVHKFTVRH